MRCDLSLAGLYNVLAIGFLMGHAVAGEVKTGVDALLYATIITAFAWLTWRDALANGSGRWTRKPGAFWWRRVKDDE